MWHVQDVYSVMLSVKYVMHVVDWNTFRSPEVYLPPVSVSFIISW